MPRLLRQRELVEESRYRNHLARNRGVRTVLPLWGFCLVRRSSKIQELRVVAMRQLNVSKTSFDFAWIDAIEKTRRHDWYEPLRRRPRIKS